MSTYQPPAYATAPPLAAHAAVHSPPTYKATDNSSVEAGPSAPLMGGSGGRSSVDSTGGEGPFDEDEDFKIGTSVSTSDVAIRMAFIRKVYSILSIQILFTAIVSYGMTIPSVVEFWRTNSWVMWVPMIGSFASLGVLFWKINSHPLNLVILGVFTLFEAITVGMVVSFYESIIVIQALIITLSVFVALTIFTFQSKYDFEGLGPWLFGGLMVMFTTSLVGIFFPYGQTTDLVLGGLGCLVFSGYIIYDTNLILKKLSPDEYILGALRLYLDAINLFLQILRVLSNSQRD